MFLQKSGYRKIAKALAPLALNGEVHYFPDFECCRNCAVHRIENFDWRAARGVLTFNEQMKEAADEVNQLELMLISPNPELHAMAQILVLNQLIESGFKLIEEDEVEENNSFMKLETGFLIWSRFNGKAKVHSSVKKEVIYDLGPKSPLANSGLVVQEWPSDYNARKMEGE